MDVNFKYNEPAEAEKIYFEQIFAEKPGGGVVCNPEVDYPPATGVCKAGEQYYPIPFYRLVAPVKASDTTIKIAKGSTIMKGTILGVGKKAVTCTEVDKSHEEYDLVTITLGVACEAGQVLYHAATSSENNAEPMPDFAPVFVTGDWIYANQGDQAVRLINGANLRKVTANIASEVAALLPGINLV